MVFSVELKSIHDLVMLDTLIDAWKAKWKADDEELKHENAEVEPEDCGDEPEAETIDESAKKAYEEALANLEKAIRDSGVDDVSFRYSGMVKRNHLKNDK